MQNDCKETKDLNEIDKTYQTQNNCHNLTRAATISQFIAESVNMKSSCKYYNNWIFSLLLAAPSSQMRPFAGFLCRSVKWISVPVRVSARWNRSDEHITSGACEQTSFTASLCVRVSAADGASDRGLCSRPLKDTLWQFPAWGASEHQSWQDRCWMDFTPIIINTSTDLPERDTNSCTAERLPIPRGLASPSTSPQVLGLILRNQYLTTEGSFRT